MFTDDNGGFFQEQKYGTPYDTSSRSRMEEKKKTKMFIPVTCKMAIDAQPIDEVFELDGYPLSDVIILGRIVGKNNAATRVTFDINDNTGVFSVTFYSRGGDHEVPAALKGLNIETGMYVRIFGNLKVFKENRAIVGTHMDIIEDFDDLTHHFLTVFLT